MRCGIRHILISTLFCIPLYGLGLTSHGLTNQQEGLRLLASIEMHRTGEFFAPSLHGTPYLDKPPGMYWAVLLLAFGDEPTDFHLRLVAAIGGLLGVISCYLCGRALLVSPRAALYAALFLATALLHVRLSRTGVIDGLLVAPTCLGVLAVVKAWKSTGLLQQVLWQLFAGACCAVLFLLKGPPGSLVFLIVILIGPVADAVVRKRRLAHLWRTLARTNPLVPITIGIGAFLIWATIAGSRIGEDALMQAATEQAAENLRVFDLSTIRKNIGALGYGAGIGSVLGIATMLWMALRPVRAARTLGGRNRRSAHLLLVWVLGSMLVFCMFGRGSSRYLAAIWPGMCLLGALGVQHALPRVSHAQARRAGRILIIAITLLAAGQTIWYSWIRATYAADRTPRELAVEVRALRIREGIPASEPIFTFEFWYSTIEPYVGAPVYPVLDRGIAVDYPAKPWSLPRFVEQLREQQRPAIMLIRGAPDPDGLLPDAAVALRAAGLRVEPLGTTKNYKVDQRQTPVIAVRIHPD